MNIPKNSTPGEGVETGWRNGTRRVKAAHEIRVVWVTNRVESEVRNFTVDRGAGSNSQLHARKGSWGGRVVRTVPCAGSLPIRAEARHKVAGGSSSRYFGGAFRPTAS
jgi:hypothetical protein